MKMKNMAIRLGTMLFLVMLMCSVSVYAATGTVGFQPRTKNVITNYQYPNSYVEGVNVKFYKGTTYFGQCTTDKYGSCILSSGRATDGTYQYITSKTGWAVNKGTITAKIGYIVTVPINMYRK